MIDKIISGGQTGCDRAALDVALELGIPLGGFCTRGRRAEDGRIPARYPLVELAGYGYPARTGANIDAADGTLIVATRETFSSGTELTCQLAERAGKTRWVVLVGPEFDANSFMHEYSFEVAAMQAAGWVHGHGVRVLNVAGPRASKWPEGYEATRRLLRGILAITNPGVVR